MPLIGLLASMWGIFLIDIDVGGPSPLGVMLPLGKQAWEI